MLDKLQQLYNTVSGREDFVLTPKTKIEHLGLSSLGLIQLICQIEDHFDIEIENRDLVRFKTVKDIVNYLNKHV